MEYCTKTTRCRHTTLFGKNRPQTHMNKWKIAVTRHKIFIGRTDAEAAAPILWPPNTKSCLNGKDPWCWGRLRAGEKESTEDEMVGWHHRLHGHEFEQAPGESEGEGRLACCSPWGCKESDTTERLNKNKNKSNIYIYIYIFFFSRKAI